MLTRRRHAYLGVRAHLTVDETQTSTDSHFHLCEPRVAGPERSRDSGDPHSRKEGSMNGHELLALLSALKPEELDVSVQVDIQEYVGVNSLTFLPGDGHDDSDDGKGILLLDVGVQGVG